MTRRAAVSVILSVAGVALLVWQVEAIGLVAVRTGLSRVGAGFLLILLISFLRFVLRSYAWMTLMARPAPLRSAVAATITGDAVGNVTPLGLVASEPAKAVYLGGTSAGELALAALMAENFFYAVSVAIYITIGAVAMLVTFNVPDVVRVTGIVILSVMAVILAAAAWVAWQKPALLSALLAQVPILRLERTIARVRDFEMRAYGSTGHEGARLGRLVAAETVFHILSFAEAWLTLGLVTGESHPVAALVFDSLNRVVNVFFKVIPMRFGVDEFTSTQMADAIGIAPNAGLVLALVRKVRLIAWAIVGFGIYALRLGKRRIETT